MTKKDQSFHDYVVGDLLGNIDGITSRAMFGGWGIYRDGNIFAIIIEGELYFKVDDTNRVDFERLGSHPFVYMQGKQKLTMSYWLLPVEVQEDREQLSLFVARAVAVSKQIKSIKGKNFNAKKTGK
ncbi:MAG: TfoX/Sxy family protein [Candidatus Zixiibacteriota bacterium]